jgi:hypothetical protein
MQDLVMSPDRIIAALRQRIADLFYENALLSAAVDQLREEIKGANGAGYRPGYARQVRASAGGLRPERGRGWVCCRSTTGSSWAIHSTSCRASR